MPSSDRQFEGPGADAINNNCFRCHSADMVLNQPALPKATWAAEVRKMINVYKAPFAEAMSARLWPVLRKPRARTSCRIVRWRPSKGHAVVMPGFDPGRLPGPGTAQSRSEGRFESAVA
jgi:hypothetical protein